MNAPVAQPPRCRECGSILTPPGNVCPACHVSQQPEPQQPVQYFVPLKSKGIAVLLTFLWLGAGHLYAGRIATGIPLLVIDAFLVLIALTGIGFIIAFPVWLMLFLVVAPLSAAAVDRANRAAHAPLR